MLIRQIMLYLYQGNSLLVVHFHLSKQLSYSLLHNTLGGGQGNSPVQKNKSRVRLATTR
jgi:hypothetical protein